MKRQLMTSAFVLILLTLFAQSTSAQPKVEIEFISSFGGLGQTQAGKFNWPAGIALDNEGRIIIADNDNNRVQRCDTQGNCEILGVEGTQLGQFHWPLGVAVDSLGRIIVSEAGNNRIQLRSTSGQWTSFGSPYQKNGPPGTFALPAGLAVDDQDRIIVADEQSDRVQVCDDSGTCTAFGSRGELPGEFFVTRDVAVASQQRILVTDYWNHRIQICSYQGDCTVFGGYGQEPGKFQNPAGIAVDSQDRVFIVESGENPVNNRLQICDLSGACVAFGEYGTGPGQFKTPQAVAVDDQDRIYIAELDGNRIQIFQATYTSDPPADVFQINAGLNDAWYNPVTPGQGFFVTVYPDIGQIFLAWFTYDTERPPQDVTALLGDPGHRWLTAFGAYADNQAVLDVEVNVGGLFDAADPAPAAGPDGTVTLQFTGCNAGTVSYDIPSIDQQGVIPIERISLDNVPLCETLNEQLQQND